MNINSLEISQIDLEKVILTNQQFLEVKNQEDYGMAGDAITYLKNQIKAIEDKRISYTKPLLETQKRLKAEADEIKEPLENLVEQIKGKMLKWKKEDDERKVLMQQSLDEQAEQLKQKHDIEFDAPTIEMNTKVQGTMSTTYEVSIWKFEIEIPDSVPNYYLMVDEEKVKEAIKNGVREIPGVRIYEHKDIRFRKS